MNNKQQKGQSADEIAQGACSMNISPSMPQNPKRKPGRAKSTNRGDDGDLIQREKGLKGKHGKIQNGMNSKQLSFSVSFLIELNNIYCCDMNF